tara:strand:- start:5674 stop:8535 length:2862 start_codon:yes stop_codon:yes gene_type:complete
LIRFYTLFFFFVGFLFSAFSQSISGVVNEYAEVTLVGNDFVEVVNTSGFQNGDKVLLMNMKGASINIGNVSAFGTITSQGDAGNFEFTSVLSITGQTITFVTELCNSFTVGSSGRVQLIRVPVYTDAIITAELTAIPWDGFTGGVLAIEATNSLTLNSDITLNGIGFRGGQISVGQFSCSDPNWANNNGGEKGEGIAEAPSGQNENRAPLANGGGGSNTGNPGAGGGANGGAGGRGGNEWFGSCALNSSFGVGAYDLDYTGYKAFLGGGGGGGYKDNGLNSTPGSNGGGIVFITSPIVNGSGFTINATGADVIGNTDSEGAGGGGAGGCVYLMTQSLNSALNINVNGGQGGDILSTLWQSACHGPGGGGGGGTIVLSSSMAPVNLNPNVSGGFSGTVLHTGPACAGTPHGAENGSGGQMLFDFAPAITPDLGEDLFLCPGDSIQLNLNTNYINYTWNDNSNDSILVIDSPGLYWVEVETICGFLRDSIVINQTTLDLGLGQEICPGTELTLEVSEAFIEQTWSTGELTPSIIVATEGVFSVIATDLYGCLHDDTIFISLSPIINTEILATICEGSEFEFEGVFLNEGGFYADTLISIESGCDSIVSLNLSITPLPLIDAGQDTLICYGDDFVLVPSGGVSYNVYDGTDWFNNIEENITVNVTANQDYIIEGTDENGCLNSDTVSVVFLSSQTPILNSETNVICPGESVSLSNLNVNAISTNWYFSNGTQALGSNDPNEFVFDQVGCSDLTMTMIDNNGCDTTMSYSDVVCAEAATASFDLNPSSIGPGNGVVNFYNTSVGATTYFWLYGDGNQSTLFQDVHAYDVNLQTGFQAVLVAYTAAGCPDTVSVTIQYQEELIYFIPNTFTPDADEHNQTFKPVFTSGFDPYNFEFSIYNRWGEVVWKSFDYTQGWDGSFSKKNGISVQEGTYSWVIKFKPKDTDKKVVINGHVNLIK